MSDKIYSVSPEWAKRAYVDDAKYTDQERQHTDEARLQNRKIALQHKISRQPGCEHIIDIKISALT